MLTHFIVGTFLIALTVVIHAIALDYLMRFLEKAGPSVFQRFRRTWKIPMLIIAVLGNFLAIIFEIWIWTLFYLGMHILPDLETALYFSTQTFTTVGYGDIHLTTDWRLLSAFQSANGFILFGWSTAFIFEIMSKLYEHEKISKTED